MAELHSSQIHPRAILNRLHLFLYSSALLALLTRHTAIVASPAAVSSLLLLLSDLILGVMWLFSQGFHWRPLRRREFPDHLSAPAASGRVGLPPLDVFVCTADPYKEPPVSVASTALSAMAFDYPAGRLSVYVSDDGCSELTLFAFMEAAKFAKYWLPFCRENGVMERSPEAYFDSGYGGGHVEDIKIMYERLRIKVEVAVQNGYVDAKLISSPEEQEIFNEWKTFTRRDHPSIVQVLLDSSKDKDVTGAPLPNLIYLSREKRPPSPHHFKAGALNALVRVSGVMTAAPVILTLDCDTHSNDPISPLRALCYFLDPAIAPTLAYVQFPQRFRGLNASDIYGGEIRSLFRVNARGIDGLCGPNYVGTGCFFSRRSLYGPPAAVGLPKTDDEWKVHGGNLPMWPESVLQSAHEAAGCRYEHSEEWGNRMGFRYGSLVEDFNTGYRMQCEGWRSVFCDPERPAFLGHAPKNLSDGLSQCRRWVVGLYQVAFSRAYTPILYGTKRASLLLGFCYSYYAFWGSYFFPLIVYGLLPQLALFYGKSLIFPKASDPWFYFYAYLVLAAYGQDLVEFLEIDRSIRRWWSDQRMWMIRGTSFIFGTLDFILSKIGVSAPGFNLTSKVNEEEELKLYENGKFAFGVSSPFFLCLATVAIVNLTSFVFGFIRVLRRERGMEEMMMQLILSGFIVVNAWPIYEAMFIRKDVGRMPRSICRGSILLTVVFFSVGCVFI